MCKADLTGESFTLPRAKAAQVAVMQTWLLCLGRLRDDVPGTICPNSERWHHRKLQLDSDNSDAQQGRM